MQQSLMFSEEVQVGSAWFGGKRFVIAAARTIKRGRRKGQVEVTFTRGRRADGSIRPGKKRVIPAEDIVVRPDAERL